MVKATASKITKGTNTDVEKARAIYEWIVENTFRNPKRAAAAPATFALCWSPEIWAEMRRSKRAVRWAGARGGPPARDVLWHPRRQVRNGNKSLGASSEKVQRQHCRAEVYLGDYGWVPVIPQTFGKVVLRNRPEIDRWRRHSQKGPRAAIRILGDELDGVHFAHDVALPGRTARQSRSSCIAGGTATADSTVSIRTTSSMRLRQRRHIYERLTETDVEMSFAHCHYFGGAGGNGDRTLPVSAAVSWVKQQQLELLVGLNS